ncbi:hypothetical protein SAMN04488513_1011014 [Pseudozobellia thermophila]|uniref:Uncharacterized protein n=1 Tax=Pseudozobellia thermophila TaxID=192903 RepID=A0A1M6D8B9_9FLAO|nr:hypothetical protein SAMN04488513_1011014 [Pseudozobellia thermophila]
MFGTIVPNRISQLRSGTVYLNFNYLPGPFPLGAWFPILLFYWVESSSPI